MPSINSHKPRSPGAAKPIELSFCRAFDAIMHNSHLKPTEKLVLIELCRYWPRAYSGSNATIAYHTGLSVRTVQYALKALSTGPKRRNNLGLDHRRSYIYRGYAHTRFGGKVWTCRVIVPHCLPGAIQPPNFTAAHK